MSTHDDRSAADRGTARHVPTRAAFALPATPAMRGPRPPALVCGDCDATIQKTFANPILEAAKKLQTYRGETTGGVGICNRCDEKRTARLEAFKNPRPKKDGVVDVPTRETESTLDNFKRRAGTKAAIETARAWLTERDRDLYFYGHTGTGKTRLAISLANEVQTKRLVAGDVVYVRVPTLIQRLKASQFDQARDAGELGRLETYVRAGLLVLDDLGAENGTPYTRTTIESLYNERVDAGRLTIITSNLPLGLTLLDQQKAPEDRDYRQALGEFLGDDRLTSRIAGNAQIVELAGDDHRLGGWQHNRPDGRSRRKLERHGD
jgi:DNA replication protein DnaC